MPTRNHLGTTSLCIAVGGMVAVDAALIGGVLHDPLWKIVATGFEAATAGAFADWFAVSALFQPIPIPFLGRHTNILVKNRERFSAGIVEMVETRWLAPASVRAKLAQFKAADQAIALLSVDARRERLLGGARGILARFAQGLDGPELASFLERVLERELRALELAPLLGRWLQHAIERGGQHALWDVLFASIERSAETGKVQVLVRELLDKSVDRYANEGLFKRVGTKIAERIGMLDYDAAATSIVSELLDVVRAASRDRAHPLRVELDRLLVQLATNLASGEPNTVKAVETLRERFVENAQATGLVRKALSAFQASVTEQLTRDDSELSRMLEGLVLRMLDDLRQDAAARERLDQFVRDAISDLVEQHHHLLGEIVAESLQRLGDRELVEQVKDKVWNDLQYIRLNGAIVGGAVGVALAAIKWLVER